MDAAANVIQTASHSGTIGGGFQNLSSGSYATVAGGRQNWASGISAFGGGGGSPVFEVLHSGAVNALSFNPTSDRNAKENVATISTAEVLDKIASLPITRWNYKDDPDRKHLGPMAQDFHAAFGLNGADDKHISVVDEGGVALAAIQGLNQKVDSDNAILRAELKRRDAENAELRQAVGELKEAVSAMNRKLNAGAK